ncbi:UDP-glucose/GDP-mannose dehydrogenase family protein [Bacillus swezeyi]|uniref:UDP-glucose 6-dehydrogenase n=1 Tax=Bacillus swezeyi TaxID=1925020 RepID=A0A1R1QWC7_9BACI|nr:UDP-glucose/GDP-mannose dehydrogenase family protein [Bacillus swezeyi]MEC1259347.1 UDP-glucose/GDP-mannose dehydrogenase family protein [Bacillus swezeyi]MED2927691.1 UDP-glucose/GDP-mannose dehydrogenase family protein [Bacillus swezeyi]MED2941950.1 UDP-glucose/GDP-mannose dehydrogenase family protein [Bacillus swezeyi]MED2965396.1 UDP-glucose/GDP-mannose dehydrogenase family protein [Bacillus swezeyi]MED2977498.1 UDP-glucose/GDP-mannose dehydrogenase family protein [Bacillus swezeyi]
MNISIVGTGYVGLVTGVCLAEIGHHVTCLDIDEKKIALLRRGISPIYEPGLEEMVQKNLTRRRLAFETRFDKGLANAEMIFIAVGTPQKENGQSDLRFIEGAAEMIGRHVQRDCLVVTKSTVPVGTSDLISAIIKRHLKEGIRITAASNPEFLREGSAIYDAFHGDRIVIGADDDKTADALEQVFQPLRIPVFKTDIRSAEMIKYASNAFLATKISFINEISNICEKIGADIESVAYGMGQDKRIGHQFLKAGIGYGGSCFPKDTNALVQIAGHVEHNFELLKSVIKVNNEQQNLLVQKAADRLGGLKGKTISLLGLAFKPNTDDMREAPSINVAEKLVEMGASIQAFDPAAMKHAKQVLPSSVQYAETIEDAIKGADAVMILTDWEMIKTFPLDSYKTLMDEPVVFDGRNCFELTEAAEAGVEYHSIGRRQVVPLHI